ncbi:alpha beta hydrolase fold family [Paramyrothecium foliicola]|nr:alpha beta hydrolase fold family [Paramyrothecium foliicola]
MGDSDKPWLLAGYSTKGMAQDALEVTNHLGWTAPRQLHVGGGSMGGMIAQHLGSLAPDRIATLTPWSTAAKIEATGGLSELLPRVWDALRPKSLETDIEDTAKGCFPHMWLESPDEASVPHEGSARCAVPNGGYKLFDNNYARFAAQEILKNEKRHFTRTGFWMQVMAASRHNMSATQLGHIADQIGRDRIMVIHGDDDQMMDPRLANTLIKGLQPAKSHMIAGLGHAPIMQKSAWFNETLEQHIRDGERLRGLL